VEQSKIECYVPSNAARNYSLRDEPSLTICGIGEGLLLDWI